MRLIDADKLTSCIRGWQKIIKETYGINDEYYKCLGNVIDTYIDDAPTVDAEPIKHGEWILEREPDGKPYCLHCSICDDDFHYIGIMTAYDFCPNCGARMKKVMGGNR